MSGRWYEPKQKKKLNQVFRDLVQALRLRLSGGYASGTATRRLTQSKSLKQFRTKLFSWTLAFGQWSQVTVLPVLRRFNWKMIQGLLAILVISFFLANSISTFAANGILSLTRTDASKSKKKTPRVGGDDDTSQPRMLGGVALGNPLLANTGSFKKDILGRNLFNAEGKLAPEANRDDNKAVRKDLSIDFEKEPCTTAEIPVAINGTIFTGDPNKSFVILKDPKIADADIYKPGDAIIDHEDFEIYKVERGRLELRKGNTKICVAISGYGNRDAASLGGESSGGGTKAAGESKEFEFDAAFISQEIGPGFATILNCAKLIPDIDSAGKMQGFKMISIATSCLFDRIQIQNGDVVTEVNGVSLKDPGQGFKLYQSLQEERTTTINIVRNGEPITRIVRVK
jgi:type II secretory pathway component PulC